MTSQYGSWVPNKAVGTGATSLDRRRHKNTKLLRPYICRMYRVREYKLKANYDEQSDKQDDDIEYQQDTWTTQTI